MASQFVAYGSLVVVLVILGSVLGAVERRERFWFVGGIAIFVLAHTTLTASERFATLLATLGILLAAASTIPLLRESM